MIFTVRFVIFRLLFRWDEKPVTMKKCLLFLALTMLCVACGCPPDIRLGNVTMQSGSFWPYSGKDELIFENNRGESVTFITDESSNQGVRLRKEVLCYKSPLDKQESYYQADVGHFQSFKALRTDYFLGLAVNLNVQADLNTSPVDTVFFEQLSVSVYSRGQVSNGGYFSMLTSPRGASPAKLPGYARSPHVIADTVLGNRRFQDVYTDRTNPSLFYTKKEGLVAIRTTEVTWTLKSLTRR